MSEAFDYSEIQPRMRLLVWFLRERLGLDTCDSGDGIENIEAGMECAVDYPHVTCTVAGDVNLFRLAIGVLESLAAVGVDGAQIEANFCANDRSSFLFVTFAGDDGQERMDACNAALALLPGGAQ